ncbi:hypothetical protein [Herbaspirillum huttiense]|uniref:Phospholipase D-like domain-containing protein n=2 Tax=Herbaspirillum huttiense TaxID=863372 RepID=A0AAJ2HDF2_9BURK|nr:hypothetical protein [Herbaspirillum huttiense]MDR9838391.1 hypothetical protein [Herbaspirillum huttiense]
MVDMNEDISLLAALKGAKFEASLITTFNSTLPFYEEVVLRRLQAAESRHNVVLMDATQCARSWAKPSLRPRLAGSTYTLVPMAAPGAFHPKICLLASKKRCILFIGSHNLTLSGFGFNREVTTYLDVHSGSAPAHKLLLTHVWSLIREWIQAQSKALPSSVLEAVYKIGQFVIAFDETHSEQHDIRLLGQSSRGPTLLEQLDGAVTKPPKRVVITGAFFDTRHAFLRELEARWPDASIKVIIDPDTVKLGGPPKGLRSQFVDARSLWDSLADHYLHAKALLLDFGDSHMLVAGSANPSGPAWLGGSRANFEVMLVRPGINVGDSRFASDLAKGFLASPMTDAALRSMPITDQEDENGNEEKIASMHIASLAVGASRVEIPLSDSPGFTHFVCYLQDGSRTDPIDIQRSADGGAMMELGKNAPAARWLELTGAGRRSLLVIVHHDAELNANRSSSSTSLFHAALANLDFSGANIEVLIKKIERAIFSDPEQVVSTSLGGAHSDAELNGSVVGHPVSLAVHIGEGVTAHKSRKRRLLKAGSLVEVLDAFLYRLGQGLPRVTPTPAADESQPLSEEELVGTEEEAATQTLPSELEQHAINAVRRRLRQLVTRMIRRLNMAWAEEMSAKRAAMAKTALVQLVAVLSLIREFRRLRHFPHWRRMSGFIDLETRQELLACSMQVLFGNSYGLLQNICDDDVHANDILEIGQTRGLLAWLAWDVGYSLLKRIDPLAPKSEKDELVLAYSYLYELLPAIALDEEHVAQLTSSVRMTAAPSVDESARVDSWLSHHLELGLEVATAPLTVFSDRQGIRTGDLICVPRSDPPAFGVVVDVSEEEIRLSQLEEERTFKRYAWSTANAG